MAYTPLSSSVSTIINIYPRSNIRNQRRTSKGLKKVHWLGTLRIDEQLHDRASCDPLSTEKSDTGPAFADSQSSNRKQLKSALPLPDLKEVSLKTPGEPCRSCKEEQLAVLLTINDQEKVFSFTTGCKTSLPHPHIPVANLKTL